MNYLDLFISIRKSSVLKLFRTYSSIASATPIWERDWNVLVILDACRTDLIREVESEYDFLNEQETLRSVGSTTIEWAEKTFGERHNEDLSNTAYITGNPNSIRAFPYTFCDQCECGSDPSPTYRDRYHTGHTVCEGCGRTIKGDRQVTVSYLDEVWRSYWDNDIGTIRPRPITDAAIDFGRKETPDRLIVHYMQPHHPFLDAPEMDRGSRIAPGDREREKQSKTVW
jgi:hypothetical protein